MTPSDNRDFDELVEAYLDNTLDEDLRAEVEQMLAERATVGDLRDENAAIVGKLQRTFIAPQPSVDEIQSWLEHAPKLQTQVGARAFDWPRRHLVEIVAACAAVILVWIFVGSWLSSRGREPFFQQQSLVSIYRDTIQRGFEPYYECKDAKRFADTFQKRQHVALKLAEMPVGTRMLGLSYSGGISRDTTAMLCEVDGQPVMVFVDSPDVAIPQTIVSPTADVQVFYEQRDGLVFYEVSPFEVARVTRYLMPE